MESFFASLKKELIHGPDFATRAQARAAIFECIEIFYNVQRRHSSLRRFPGGVRAISYNLTPCPLFVGNSIRRQDVDSEREEEELLQALDAHNQKEENVLYPAIDRLASAEEKADAFRKIEELPEEAYRTCCGHAGHVHIGS